MICVYVINFFLPPLPSILYTPPVDCFIKSFFFFKFNLFIFYGLYISNISDGYIYPVNTASIDKKKK